MNLEEREQYLASLGEPGKWFSLEKGSAQLVVVEEPKDFRRVFHKLGFGSTSDLEVIGQALLGVVNQLHGKDLSVAEISHLNALRKKVSQLEHWSRSRESRFHYLNMLKFLKNIPWLSWYCRRHRFPFEEINTSFRRIDEEAAHQQVIDIIKLKDACAISDPMFIELLNQSMGLNPFKIKELSKSSQEEILRNLSSFTSYQRYLILERLEGLDFLRRLDFGLAPYQSLSVADWKAMCSVQLLEILKEIQRYSRECTLSEEGLGEEFTENYELFRALHPHAAMSDFFFGEEGLGQLLDSQLVVKSHGIKALEPSYLSLGHDEDVFLHICHVRYANHPDKLTVPLMRDLEGWYRCLQSLSERCGDACVKEYARDVWNVDLYALPLGRFQALLTKDLRWPVLLDLARDLGKDELFLNEWLVDISDTEDERLWTFFDYELLLQRLRDYRECQHFGSACSFDERDWEQEILKRIGEVRLSKLNLSEWQEAKEFLQVMHALEEAWSSCSFLRSSIEVLLEKRYGCGDLYLLPEESILDLKAWLESLRELEDLTAQDLCFSQDVLSVFEDRFHREFQGFNELSVEQVQDLVQWYEVLIQLKELSKDCGHTEAVLESTVSKWCQERELEVSKAVHLTSEQLRQLADWYEVLKAILHFMNQYPERTEIFAARIHYQGPVSSLEDMVDHYCRQKMNKSMYACDAHELPEKVWCGTDVAAVLRYSTEDSERGKTC